MHTFDEVTVAVRNVSKTYRADNKRSIFRSSPSRRSRKRVRAVRDVSLVAHRGECVGVLGRNGSGKSTLMRLVAGDEAPDTGEILVSEAPTLLNVSAALQPRLDGMTNIKLGLLAQGVQYDEIPDLAKEIIDFADIGDAINRPMATYSSGMGARLKFAISTAVRREILLIDEALGTGDASFNERAQARMSGFLDEAGTIFFVSHSMESVKAMCSRVIWLEQGEIIADGPIDTVGLLYRKWMARTARNNKEDAASLVRRVKRIYEPPCIELQ